MRKWFVWLVVPALLLGACSKEGGPSAEEDPTGALVAAFEETGKAEAQTITVSIQSTPESLVAASEGSLTPEVAETILGSSLTFSGTTSDDPANQSARVALSIPGTDGFELMVVGTDLYVRADVRGIAELAGQDPAMIDQFLQTPQAQQAPFLEAAANGEFIKIEGADELAAGAGAGGLDPGALTEQQAKLVEQFGQAIQEDATVTSEGSDDVGEHLVASIPLQSLYQTFTEFAGDLGAPIPPGSFAPESEIPEGDVSMDIWISDGRIAQFEFDIVELGQEFGGEGEVPAGVEQFAIRVALTPEAEEVTPPEDAVTVTGEELFGLFLGGFGGDLGGGETGGGESPGTDDLTGGNLDCSIYEGLPPESFDGLPQETLDQLETLCPGIVPGT